ncbi:floral homeotic protein AGAMOUS-like [Euphorbia lathyris]|uniref:floral homeotic protein AGAMOUS-like n=1 Tax=Euphorbia lathyris TaxID=212925 RepID=UPI0033143768
MEEVNKKTLSTVEVNMTGKKQSKGKQKIEMKKIENEEDRLISFSKRRSGIYKKSSELVTLCGAEIGFLVFSPAGKPFSFGHSSLESITNRFLGLPIENPNPVDEARRKIRIQELTQLHNEMISSLEDEKDKGIKLKKAMMKDKGKGKEANWWDARISELNLEDLRKLHARFEEVHTNLCKKLSLENINGASSSSSSFINNGNHPIAFNSPSFMNHNHPIALNSSPFAQPEPEPLMDGSSFMNHNHPIPLNSLSFMNHNHPIALNSSPFAQPQPEPLMDGSSFMNHNHPIPLNSLSFMNHNHPIALNSSPFAQPEPEPQPEPLMDGSSFMNHNHPIALNSPSFMNHNQPVPPMDGSLFVNDNHNQFSETPMNGSNLFAQPQPHPHPPLNDLQQNQFSSNSNGYDFKPRGG